MAFIDYFKDCMPHTITLETVATRDNYGKPATYNASVSYAARVNRKRRVMKGMGTGGQDVVSACSARVGEVLTLTADARITLPDGTQPPIISWDQAPDEGGYFMTHIFFGAV